MATTTTNVLNALRYTYGVNKVQYVFNQESPTWANLSKVKKGMGGRGQFIIPIITQNPGAFTGIAEGGALPTALAPATTEALFALQEYVGMYDLTWKLIQDSSTDKFAFQQALQLLDDGLRRRVIRNLNSDLITDGTGALGFLPSAQNSSPVTITALPRMETGMVIDIVATSDNNTKRATAVTVTGVDTAARTWKTGGAIASTAAGDRMVIQNTLSTAAGSLHARGLLAVIDSANPPTNVTNIGAINRSTAGNEFWAAYVDSNSGTNRPLTEDILLKALDGGREKGGSIVKMFISNLALVRRYHEILAGERYFALSKPGVLEGGIGRREAGMNRQSSDNSSRFETPGDGMTPYEFSGIPWYVDPYFDPNVVVGFDTDHFFLGVGDNDVPRPISEVFDNVPFFRQTTSATFEVAWYYQMQLLTDNPAAGIKVKDLAES